MSFRCPCPWSPARLPSVPCASEPTFSNSQARCLPPPHCPQSHTGPGGGGPPPPTASSFSCCPRARTSWNSSSLLQNLYGPSHALENDTRAQIPELTYEALAYLFQYLLPHHLQTPLALVKPTSLAPPQMHPGCRADFLCSPATSGESDTLSPEKLQAASRP